MDPITVRVVTADAEHLVLEGDWVAANTMLDLRPGRSFMLTEPADADYDDYDYYPDLPEFPTPAPTPTPTPERTDKSA